METFLDILKNRIQRSLSNTKSQIGSQLQKQVGSINLEAPETNQGDSANLLTIKCSINTNEETQGQAENIVEYHIPPNQQNSLHNNKTNDKQIIESDRGKSQPSLNRDEVQKKSSECLIQSSIQPISSVSIASLPNLNLNLLAQKIITQTVSKSKGNKPTLSLQNQKVQKVQSTNDCKVNVLKGILRNDVQVQKDIAMAEKIEIRKSIIDSIKQSQKKSQDQGNNKIRKNSTETVPKMSSTTIVQPNQKPSLELNKAKTVKFTYPKPIESQKPVYFNPASIPNQKRAQLLTNTAPAPVQKKSQDMFLQQSKAMISAFKKLTETKESKPKQVIQISSSSSSSSSSSDSQSSQAKKNKKSNKKTNGSLNLKEISDIMIGRVTAKDKLDEDKNRSHSNELHEKNITLKPEEPKANLLEQIKQKLQSFSPKRAAQGNKKSKKSQKTSTKIVLNTSKSSEQAENKAQENPIPPTEPISRSPWIRLQPQKRDIDDKSPIHKLYELDELKDVAFTVDVKLLTMKEEDIKAIAKKNGLGVLAKKTGPENAAKNTYYALKSILKDSPSNAEATQHPISTLNLQTPATSLYSTFIKRRMPSSSEPIDLGVLSIDELVEHCFNKRIISQELYTEYVSFSSQEKTLQFLRLFTDNRINEWNFKQLKITLLDHRRLSQWLVHLYPKEYTIGPPMALNNSISVFLISMYELTEKEYNTMLNIIDELSNLSLWRTLKIKYPKTQVKAEQYPPLGSNTDFFYRNQAISSSNEMTLKRPYVSPNPSKRHQSINSSEQLQKGRRQPSKKRII